MRDSRRLVYVSGAPGSGKTSLAVPLTAELGYPLLANDRIKEALHDAFGAPESDLAWSRRLGGAAMELLWTLAADAPAVVIEANFRPHCGYGKAKLSALAARPVEVYCARASRPALQRPRHSSGARHHHAPAGGHSRVRSPSRDRHPRYRGHDRPGPCGRRRRGGPRPPRPLSHDC